MGEQQDKEKQMEQISEFALDLDLAFLPEWARHPSEIIRIRREEEPERRRGRRAARWQRRGERRSAPTITPVRRQLIRKPPEAPDVELRLVPDAKGVESLVKQIKLTGRSYPVVDIARMILQKPERYNIEISVKSNGDAKYLLVCTIDQSIWLTEAELVEYVLENHLETFYKIEKIPQDPPKGVYTFVAQCGLSGEILGPPNYHEYQKKLQELHAKKFPHIPFEEYKARVRIIKDPEAVKKWVEMMSYREEYECLNVPEPLRLKTRQEVEKHFREVHLPNISAKLEKVTIPAAEPLPRMSPWLERLVERKLRYEQEEFPESMLKSLCDMFRDRGLHFFKVNEKYLHVCVAKPSGLDLESTLVSDRIRNIIEFIKSHPGATRKDLLLHLAPPQIAEGETGTIPTEPTEEQKQLIADLHWLLHQGYVIEYTTGRLEVPPVKKEQFKFQKKRPSKPSETAETMEEGTHIDSGMATQPKSEENKDDLSTSEQTDSTEQLQTPTSSQEGNLDNEEKAVKSYGADFDDSVDQSDKSASV